MSAMPGSAGRAFPCPFSPNPFWDPAPQILQGLSLGQRQRGGGSLLGLEEAVLPAESLAGPGWACSSVRTQIRPSAIPSSNP